MCEPLTCPNPDCGEPWPLCIEKKGIRRRYKCLKCRFRFTTIEQVEAAVEGQAFQASMFRLLTEANGSREQAKDIMRGKEP